MTAIQKLCSSICKSNLGLWFAVIVGILTALSVSQNASAESVKGIAITVEGSGPDMIFIPGLNSASGTFTSTCDAFKQHYRCHMLHLPGFAGQAPTAEAQAAFLTTMRDGILQYVQQQQLHKPILLGHSLGGVLSLMLAIENPELAKQLVIVDSLPYYPAIQNPTLTVEIMRPQAELMRTQMNNQSDTDFYQNAQASLGGMSNNTDNTARLLEWSKTSDRITTTQAMYDMMTLDLRTQVSKIKTPTLVLGAWAAYKNFGATKESTTALYASQYAQLKEVDIRLSEAGFHFLTWDDPEWVNQQIADVLNNTKN